MTNMTRIQINLFKETATVQELIITQVATTQHELVKVPASSTDWSFMKTVRQPVTSFVERKEWVTVEVRPATEGELNEEYHALMDDMELA